MDVEINILSAENPELSKVSSFEPEVGQNIALLALPTDLFDFALLLSLPSPPNSSSERRVSETVNQTFSFDGMNYFASL